MLSLPEFRFHHFGLAIRTDGAALRFLTALGYDCGEVVYDELQNVRLRMCVKAGDPAIEIIMPGVGNGPLTTILRKYEQLFYHSCYEVPDHASALQSLDEIGVRAIEVSPPKPAILFGGRKVSFYTLAGYGLIELLEK
jgi:hypothetical protein